MPRMAGPVPLNAVPLLGLIMSLFLLSSRYYTSAAYERPIHLAVLALVVAAFSLLALARFSDQDCSPKTLFLRVLQPSASDARVGHCGRLGGPSKENIAYILKSSVTQIRPLLVPFCLLVGCIVLRVYLFWFIVRTTQCSTLGIEAFLPLIVLLFDAFSISAIRLSKSASGEALNLGEITNSRPAPRRLGPALAYGIVALAWGFAAVSALGQSRTTTGTVCPSGWQWRTCTLGAQFLSCFIDALLLVNISDLRTREADERMEKSDFLPLVLLTSALLGFLIVSPTLFVDGKLYWTFCPHWLDVKDLAIDSALAATAVVCGFSVFHLLHPTSVALLISAVCLFGFHVPIVGAGILLRTASSISPLAVQSIAASLIGVLCWLALHPAKSLQPSTTSFMHRSLVIVFVGVCLISLFTSSLLPNLLVSLPLSRAVNELTAAADAKSRHWTSQAATSQTLEEAVIEYKRRYGLPPPPNFDRWYQFALDNKSPVIDDFNQIHEDLLQFWAVEPATIRSRTSHLLDYSILEMGGMRIRNGTVEKSPHVPGSHRWMMDSMQRMIEPFAKWLPDMDIALNLADECRMAVPYEQMLANKDVARRVMADMVDSSRKLHNSTRESNESQWPANFREPLPREAMSPHFSDNIRWQLYYDLVAPSCPPSSPARRRRWWDWSTVCVECMLPHSVLTDDGSVVTNTEAAHNLCHQPDMAYLDGFIMSPSAMVGTDTLFPIFSQGRVGGFSDIMIPSPWNFDQKSLYNETADVPWDKKQNALFWRGSSSDGYAAHGSWTGFLRARFVHEAYEREIKSAGNRNCPLANVSFAGTMSRCHEEDCGTELHMFHEWADGMQATAPRLDDIHEGGKHFGPSQDSKSLASQVTPFGDHWHFRHLVDLDGAGFSGRFLPFLKSHSLVYRAALFHAWFDERLSAWHHYIPVDVRLGSGFWALLDFFSGKGSNILDGNKSNKHAQRIADQGRDWALKALRTEDMQIYMFRLLLEWGRVIDDDREYLGFDI